MQVECKDSVGGRIHRKNVDKENFYALSKVPGFTLIELLVVIVVIGILVALLLPALSHAKKSANAIVCINNEKQLILAWEMYASDYGDRVVGNGHAVAEYSDPMWITQGTTPPYFWVSGDSHFYIPPYIDTKYIVGGEYALFASYIASPKTYRCAEDKSVVGTAPRIRSYAMNAYIGWVVDKGELDPNYRIYDTVHSIQSPSETFVFTDVAPASLCMPSFIVQMSDTTGFYHYPSALHNNSAVMSFSDGHVEKHLWNDKRTHKNMMTGVLGHWDPSPNNGDITWLQQHTTTKKD